MKTTNATIVQIDARYFAERRADGSVAIRDVDGGLYMAHGAELAMVDELGRLRGEAEARRKDAERLDWLERKTVQVREPLRYGSRELFWASPDVEDVVTNLRQKIDAAMKEQQL